MERNKEREKHKRLVGKAKRKKEYTVDVLTRVVSIYI